MDSCCVQAYKRDSIVLSSVISCYLNIIRGYAMGTTKPTLVLYGLALFASFEYPELCLYCRSCNITMTVLMGMTCY